MKRIFGPVPSRRLGRSLGIDVIPAKTCSFDCVYCECGATTDLTCSRREFYPLEELLEELRERLVEIPEQPDVITLSGAGEPTLYSRMGELILEAKRISRLPVAVITNSSLMIDPEVREELYPADYVLPSLDSALQESFEKINRPHPSCRIDSIIAGLAEFAGKYEGRLFLEILLLEGYNTDDVNLDALRRAVEAVSPDSIQLNTAVRPGTVRRIVPLDGNEMERLRRSFGPRCEIIADTHPHRSREDKAVEEKILSMIERRPCTVDDISLSLGVPIPGAVKMLDSLSRAGIVTCRIQGGKRFYIGARSENS